MKRASSSPSPRQRIDRRAQLLRDLKLRRTPDGDVIDPDGERVQINVIPISPRELRSFRAFRNATLERTWPPYIVTRAEWRSIVDEIKSKQQPEENDT